MLKSAEHVSNIIRFVSLRTCVVEASYHKIAVSLELSMRIQHKHAWTE